MKLAPTVFLLAAPLLLTCTSGRSPEAADDGRGWPVHLDVEVVGANFEWSYRYPGADRELGTADDVVTAGDLHFPAHTRGELHLVSRDYVYTFRLPDFEAHQVAVPDIDFAVEVETAGPGTFELLGDQMCGYRHEGLIVQFVVQPVGEFENWLESNRR